MLEFVVVALVQKIGFIRNCNEISVNAGIRRGRFSSEEFDSLGIVMKSLQYGPKTLFFMLLILLLLWIV